MGRIQSKRHINFRYWPAIIEYYKLQSDDFKKVCKEKSRGTSYSAMNLFYSYLLRKTINEKSGEKGEDYVRKGDL